MVPEESIFCIRAFLDMFQAGRPRVGREQLQAILDALAYCVTSTETSFDPTEWPDPPSFPYEARREQAAKCFPEFGYYNVAANIGGEINASGVHVGDAIDDLADILGDLTEVAWRWDNTSRTDALWHFALQYRQHWGTHLRCLQLYLHALEYGDGRAV